MIRDIQLEETCHFNSLYSNSTPILQLRLEIEKKSSLVPRARAAKSITCETDGLHSCTRDLLTPSSSDGLSVLHMQDSAD